MVLKIREGGHVRERPVEVERARGKVLEVLRRKRREARRRLQPLQHVNQCQSIVCTATLQNIKIHC